MRCDAAYCEIGVDTALPRTDDRSLKNLHTLALAFNNANVHPDNITRT